MGPEFENGDGRLRPSRQQHASPAQRGPRRDAQPLHATPLAAVPIPRSRGPVLIIFFRAIFYLFNGNSADLRPCITPCDSLSALLTVPCCTIDHLHSSRP